MYPTGSTGFPPERGSVPGEPARTHWATAREWESQLTGHPHRPQPSSSPLPFRCRKRIEELTLELSETLRKLEISEKEKRQFQKTVSEQEMKLNDHLDRIKMLQHQV